MRTDSQPPAHGEFQVPLPDANELLLELQELREEGRAFSDVLKNSIQKLTERKT